MAHVVPSWHSFLSGSPSVVVACLKRVYPMSTDRCEGGVGAAGLGERRRKLLCLL